jgi:hypothetical protein
MSEMLSNPLVQSVMSNPALVQTMLKNDPRFKRMAEVMNNQ